MVSGWGLQVMALAERRLFPAQMVLTACRSKRGAAVSGSQATWLANPNS